MSALEDQVIDELAGNFLQALRAMDWAALGLPWPEEAGMVPTCLVAKALREAADLIELDPDGVTS